jgi:hypothetical protein
MRAMRYAQEGATTLKQKNKSLFIKDLREFINLCRETLCSK